MQDRGTPPAGLMRQAPDHRVTRLALAPATSTPPVLTSDPARQHCMVWPHALARHFQAQVIQACERAQVRAIKDSIGHVEVFQMDGVGISIIERPRPLPGHDTPNPTQHPYTLKCEEPHIVGIATFADTVESSFNRIACETAPSALAACVPRRARGPDGMRVGPLIRTWVRHLARGPSNPHVGPMARAWAAPWRISRGLRACRGANAHVQRFMCERHTRPGAVASTTQAISPTTPRCRRLLPRWFATWAAPPRTATSPPASVGNCATRGPVRDLPADDIATKRGELHH